MPLQLDPPVDKDQKEQCHLCHCASHCDERLCGTCKECAECGCWPCLHKKNPANYDADLLS